MSEIRVAKLEDLDFLTEFEKTCFEESVRSSRRSLKNSIISDSQEVLVLEREGKLVASAVILIYKKTIRIFSIAVLPEYRGQSIGKVLMEHIINFCRVKGICNLSLEADAKNINLIKWYQSFGFIIEKEIEEYYGTEEPAYKMQLIVEKAEAHKRKGMRNIVVVDHPVHWLNAIDTIEVISAENFINEKKYQNAKGVRIFNLCSSYEYQSIGYYVSLLASARNQRAIPNVTTIKDFTDSLITQIIGYEEYELMQKSLQCIKTKEFSLKVYFGKTKDEKYLKLAKSFYRLFEAPLLEFSFEFSKGWNLKKVSALPVSDIDNGDSLIESARNYFNQKRFTISRFKEYKYDMAILVDPEEENPPSCKVALSKFKVAAEKIGFYVEFITKDDYQRVGEFDALFIRTTTNVNDYTYQFSRYAYAEGLAVVDDPWSILKCSNKLYLAERMKTEGITTPKSLVISKNSKYENIADNLQFPLILKKPDSAFSLGVFKVKDREELNKTLEMLFETSELVVAQEYIKTDFDWRIGVLDNAPLFACKYYMAKNHWQIYNWQTNNNKYLSGICETLHEEDVSAEVIETAVKAASFMGDGLYGVDLKEIDGKVYVIEVNDNPNIDYRVEDKMLGDGLYMRIMKFFYNRIDTARNIKRRVST